MLPSTVLAGDFLEDGEQLLDERLNPDGVREIFTTKDGEFYRKFIKDDEILDVESIQIFPTGLKDRPKVKDTDIGEILPEKLRQRGVYVLPSKLDYSKSPYLPPVGRQYENSCVGWSTGYYLRTYQQGLDIGWKIKDKDNTIYTSRVFSPTFIYNQINNGTDDGAYVEDAGDLLKRIGASPLKYFPYIPGDYWTQPDATAIRAAYPHRIRDWRILYTYNDSPDYIIQKTKEYLNTGDLLVAGILVGFKFMYPMIDHLGNAIITTDKYANYGHAVVVVGYDDNLETPEGYGAFKIINSYGEDWGNNGFAYMSYDAYVSSIQAGYVFTDLVNDTYLWPIENVEGEPISPTRYKITFDKVKGASGYRLLDENKKVLSNFYTNEYIIKLDEPGKVVRYIQPFKGNILGEMTAVEVDTTEVEQERLKIEVLEGVEFNIKFSGSGKYDIEIVDDTGKKVYESKNLSAQSGINTIYWNGLDLNNNPAEDGKYNIKILDKTFNFNKESKLDSVSSFLNIYKGETKSLDVNLSAKKPGILNLYIELKDRKIILFKNIVLNENRNYNYNIDILKYVSSDELKDINLIVEIS